MSWVGFASCAADRGSPISLRHGSNSWSDRIGNEYAWDIAPKFDPLLDESQWTFPSYLFLTVLFESTANVFYASTLPCQHNLASNSALSLFVMSVLSWDSTLGLFERFSNVLYKTQNADFFCCGSPWLTYNMQRCLFQTPKWMKCLDLKIVEYEDCVKLIRTAYDCSHSTIETSIYIKRTNT